MKMGMKVTRTFFDSDAITAAVDVGTRRVLSRFGAFVRQVARGSMRRTTHNKSSKPGQPPYAHVGLLKKLLFFGYDTQSKSVAIGPEPLSSQNDAPLLEYGGTAVRQRTDTGKRYLATYKERPFMRPALAKELPKLPPMWRDSVKR